MKLGNEIKFYFKTLNIPVRVRTVAVKNPFVQVWISPLSNKVGSMEPLKYTHEFPLILRQNLLKVIYGDDCSFAAGGNAGNVNPHSLSMHQKEWEALKAKMEKENEWIDWGFARAEAIESQNIS